MKTSKFARIVFGAWVGGCLSALDKAIQAYDNTAWAFLKNVSSISQDVALSAATSSVAAA